MTTPPTPPSPPSTPRIQVKRESGIDYITFPNGKVDGTTVRELYEQGVQLIDSHNTRAVVDLTGVGFVPSGMMGMLVTVKKKISGSGGQMHIVVPNTQVRSSFEVMHLDRILMLYESIEDAIAKFKR